MYLFAAIMLDASENVGLRSHHDLEGKVVVGLVAEIMC
jgi:hypothetical protein